MAEYNAKHYFVMEYQSGEETGRNLFTNVVFPGREWGSRKSEQYLWAFTDVEVKKYWEEYEIPSYNYTFLDSASALLPAAG